MCCVKPLCRWSPLWHHPPCALACQVVTGPHVAGLRCPPLSDTDVSKPKQLNVSMGAL